MIVEITTNFKKIVSDLDLNRSLLNQIFLPNLLMGVMIVVAIQVIYKIK